MCHTKSPVHKYLRNIKSSTMQLYTLWSHISGHTNICVTSAHPRNFESATLPRLLDLESYTLTCLSGNKCSVVDWIFTKQTPVTSNPV